MLSESDRSESTNWPEPRVERLLDWFFSQEMPAALRENAPRIAELPLRSPVAVTSPRRSASRSAGYWLLPLCVLTVLGSGWILSSLPQETAIIAAAGARPAIVELNIDSPPLLLEQVTYAGSSGTYEQRTELRWSSQSYFEPRAGTWVEWSAPELVIDIDPIASVDPNTLK
jgi:hypothetical protein